MTDDTRHADAEQIAGLLGPAIVAMVASEFPLVQPHLYDQQIPPVVYLSGVLMFVAGLAIVRAHHHWRRDWTVLVTLTGWFALVLGLVRMFAAGAYRRGSGAVAPLAFMVIESPLLLCGLFLTFKAYYSREAARSFFVRATPEERGASLPGDDRIPDPIDSITHAITIDRPSRDVWPWLVQMGAGRRAGWYSYDWIDNGRRPSADRVVEELQHPVVGTIFPALPGVTDAFTLDAIEPECRLTLTVPAPGGGEPLVTWSFVLRPIGSELTRLLVRVRGGKGYRFHGLPRFLTRPAIRFVHFIMERRQLHGIAARAERGGRAGA